MFVGILLRNGYLFYLSRTEPLKTLSLIHIYWIILGSPRTAVSATSGVMAVWGMSYSTPASLRTASNRCV